MVLKWAFPRVIHLNRSQGGCDYAAAVADRCASNESDDVETLEKAQDNLLESEVN